MPASDQGVTSDRYSLIPRTLIFVTRGTTILLLKGAPHKRLWAGKYNGVGGHIEQGEGVLGSAERELAEETKLTVKDLRLCGVVTVDTGQPAGIGIYVLRAECVAGEPIPSEEGTPEWIPFQQVNQLPLVEDLPILLEHLLAMQPGDPPFSAHTYYDHLGCMVVRFE